MSRNEIFWKKWAEGLLDLLYPPKCPFCQALLSDGEKAICVRCRQTLPWLAGRSAQQTGEFYALCVSPLGYGGRVKESIHRYKFSGRRWYAAVYGELMAQCVAEQLAGRYDVVTWAPLSRVRLRKRGYDQAGLLARAVVKRDGGTAVPLLRKCRDTMAQSGLSEDAARRGNVLGAYEILPGGRVVGRRVLLVDDVVTTGATLSECARVLKTAGAAEVVCVTLARARGETAPTGDSARIISEKMGKIQ